MAKKRLDKRLKKGVLGIKFKKKGKKKVLHFICKTY